jgi:hypothetical protein
VAKSPSGFVPLKSLRQRASSPADAIAEIRQIYFKTSRETIEHDFAHALELLKSLPGEDDRERATVFMHGLAEMRRDWSGGAARAQGKGRGSKVKAKAQLRAESKGNRSKP